MKSKRIILRKITKLTSDGNKPVFSAKMSRILFIILTIYYLKKIGKVNFFDP